jgi:hypothetical protein
MKIFLKHRKFIVCSFFCFFALTSCITQNIDSASSYHSTHNKNTATTEIGSTFSYHSIHYRGTATINMDGQSYRGQFNFVNVIDSLLYVQLNVAGFEAGRVLATPENILYINKLQREYYQGDYIFFQQFVDVDIDFFTLQAIFNNFETSVPKDVKISYLGELVDDGYSFFNTLIFEHEEHPLKLRMDIKKVTFNNVPKVSANVPNNYSRIGF